MPSKPKRFQLGDHIFREDVNEDPLARFSAPKRPIRGAVPPTYLDGLVVEATKKSPAAKALFKGEFCGHGEPTMTIFDVVIDGASEIELSAIADGKNGNYLVVAVRTKRGKWFPIFRRTWEERASGLSGIKRRPVTKSEDAILTKGASPARVSIGFEYPSDADSRDCVSWVTIDIVAPGFRKPKCIVNAELL